MGDGDKANRNTGTLDLVNHPVFQGHWAWLGLVDTGIMKTIVRENRDWNHAGSNGPARIRRKFHQSNGSKLVRAAMLIGRCRDRQRGGGQQYRATGPKTRSTI